MIVFEDPPHVASAVTSAGLVNTGSLIVILLARCIFAGDLPCVSCSEILHHIYPFVVITPPVADGKGSLLRL